MIIVTHDTELLNNCVNKLWHIDDGKVKIFSGNYDHYLDEIKLKRSSIKKKLAVLNQEKKFAHQSLMKEQAHAKRSRLYGEKKVAEGSWPPIIAYGKKTQSQLTTGKKKREISEKKQAFMKELSRLRLPEVINPKFSLTANEMGSSALISINDANIGYNSDELFLQEINLLINAKERVAILGNNGSGKSTLIKAIMNDQSVLKTGNWRLPKLQEIGYLDQHYSNLNSEISVYESISTTIPEWHPTFVRKHLNAFLFRKNEEVDISVKHLSGGERARLSLAKIAANTPKLLILDEITNNIDLETRNHVTQVLKKYPGTVIIISHDEDFLQEIGIDSFYRINGKRITKNSI